MSTPEPEPKSIEDRWADAEEPGTLIVTAEPEKTIENWMDDEPPADDQ
ncbi:hypothetical protein ACIBG7_12675 [Nonomuraea sp. NPDC050328]